MGLVLQLSWLPWVFISFHRSIAAVMVAMGVQLQVVFDGRPRDVKVMPAPDLHLTSVRKKESGNIKILLPGLKRTSAAGYLPLRP